MKRKSGVGEGRAARALASAAAVVAALAAGAAAAPDVVHADIPGSEFYRAEERGSWSVAEGGLSAAGAAGETAPLKYRYAGEWGKLTQIAPIRFLSDLSIGPNGNLYVLYSGDDTLLRVRMFNRAGESLWFWGDEGSCLGGFFIDGDLTVGPSGVVYVVGAGGDYVVCNRPGGEGPAGWRYERWSGGQSLEDVVAAPDGTVFVVDGSGRVDRFSAEGEHLGVWVPKDAGGKTLAVRMLAIGADGRRYVAVDERRIWRFDANGLRPEEIAWEDDFGLAQDFDVAADGAVFVSDGTEVRVFESEGVSASARHKNRRPKSGRTFINALFGEREDGEPAFIRGLAVGVDGVVYLGNDADDVIYFYGRNGKRLGAIDVATPPLDTFEYPEGIAVSPEGNVYVADSSNCRVVYFSATGDPLGDWGRELGIGWRPQDVAWTPDGCVAVLYGATVRVFSPGGEFRRVWEFGAYGRNFAVGPDGSVYFIPGPAREGVIRYDADGQILAQTGAEGVVPGQFGEFFEDVAAGPDGTVYAADRSSQRLHLFSAEGKYLTAWPSEDSGAVFSPHAVAVGPDGGVFAASGDRLFRFDREGRIVERCPIPRSREGSTAELSGLAVGPDGTVYAVDCDNHRIIYFRRRKAEAPREPGGGLRYRWTDGD